MDTQCIAHVCHNSLKWCMWEVFPDTDHMEDCWCLLAGLTNGASLLHTYLPQWLAEHLNFMEWYLLPPLRSPCQSGLP